MGSQAAWSGLDHKQTAGCGWLDDEGLHMKAVSTTSYLLLLCRYIRWCSVYPQAYLSRWRLDWLFSRVPERAQDQRHSHSNEERHVGSRRSIQGHHGAHRAGETGGVMGL